MAFNVNALGFGDNVVDRYEHIHTMYPGGNAVNFAVYAKKCGAARSAYMGIFGNDAAAEHVIASLEDEGIELDKCEQMIGENGAARVTVVDGDRVFLGSNEGGIRGDARYVLDRFDLSYMKQFDVVHSGNYCFTERLAWVKGLGPRFVSATAGAEGCIAYDGERYYRQLAKPVTDMKDTMGAGDSFLTSFLMCYLDSAKRGEDGAEAIERALDFAAGFASTVCGMEGSWGHGAPIVE